MKQPPAGRLIEVRKATAVADDILAQHYLALWDSYGTPENQMQPDAKARVLAFIRDARKRRGLAVFIATVGGEVAGSIACQRHISPYPDVVMPAHRQFGYIWSVYVDPAHRRLGIARRLVDHALDHLRSIGCTTAVLHSSEAGETLYEQAGFKLAKEMRLAL
jgi:ribosomal protein S18 acetylase RimI-like enzyme